MEKPGESKYCKSIWKRIIFMLLFFVLFRITEIVIFVIAVIQIGFVFLDGSRNKRLLDISENIIEFAYQVMQYFVFQRNEKPFPFSDWPKSNSDDHV